MAPDYEILTDLGLGPHDTQDVYKLGAWFWVPERAITEKPGGGPFAVDKAEQGGDRPVVLASPWGPFPNLVFYPRSASSPCGYPHHKHDHRSVFPKCGINKDGKVLLRIPVTVKAPELSTRNWSCAEPGSSGLYAEIKRRLRP